MVGGGKRGRVGWGGGLGQGERRSPEEAVQRADDKGPTETTGREDQLPPPGYHLSPPVWVFGGWCLGRGR